MGKQLLNNISQTGMSIYDEIEIIKGIERAQEVQHKRHEEEMRRRMKKRATEGFIDGT